MKKALLEEHVRYGEARFRDKELVRPFVNRIYQDLEELEEAMKPKTCDGCKYFRKSDKACFMSSQNTYIRPASIDFSGCSKHEPKDNA